MLKILKKHGFASLIEVVVTSIIFILAAFGMLSAMSMLKPHSSDSDVRLDATYIGKNVIDQLRDEIDQTTWNDASSNLAVNTLRTRNIGPYTVTYYLTEVTGYTPGEGPRQLFMNVTYPD